MNSPQGGLFDDGGDDVPFELPEAAPEQRPRAPAKRSPKPAANAATETQEISAARSKRDKPENSGAKDAEPETADDIPFDLPDAPRPAFARTEPPGEARVTPLTPAPPPPANRSISQRAMAAAPTPYLEGLNPEQRRAVETLDGPVLVLAGAGTGKTRVLTTRIAHILATRRAFPSQVLAVTFTNKAAREMKNRIGDLIGGAVEGMPWLGTFHSIGVKILRRHYELVGLKSGFTILDTDDQIRLLKQVIEADNLDKDRWPARQLAGLIDSWKNRGLTPEKVPKGESFAFANGKGAQLYAAYQQRLKDLNAVDFGDLLLENIRLFTEHPDVLADYHARFRFILVDEYQDTNVAQYLWLRLLAQGVTNVCCVGDEDQCLAAGTSVTMGDGTEKPIESVKAGEAILSCFGSGDFRPARVLAAHRRKSAAPLVRLKMTSGREITSSAKHVHFAGYRHGLTPQTYFVYLMEKRGFGFRLGTSQLYTEGQKQPVLGFLQRARQEHADALWIVSTHASENASRFEEMRLSLAYGIPTIPFVPRKGKIRNGIVHNASAIARLYGALDTRAAALRLMAEHALSLDEPHHLPQSRNSIRRNVNVTLCGDHRGATPMHRISIVGNDREGADKLRDLGFSVRPAKEGSNSWRVETANASWREIALAIERMRDAFELNVIRNAQLGADNRGTDGEKATSSLPFRRAASVRPGMAVFTHQGYDIVESIETVTNQRDVYDLDIEATHNFLGNGIVTHNSIYGWRGAEVDNILRFETDFPGATVIRLERNYRSTGHILGAASGLIAKNASRLGKTLFTDGDRGLKVALLGVWDDEEEARTIGEAIEALKKNGHKLNQIAVLLRASFQMRVIEDRFITLALPYRVIGGPRFYERQEIKDAIAYLDVTLNPANDLKFERIVNVPKRGIGDTTVKRIHELARVQGVPMFDAARQMIETDELPGKARKALADLIRLFDRWRNEVPRMKHTELAELVLDESGYTAMWQADKSPQAHSRLENLKELVRFMHEFESLPGFLEHVSLVMDAEAGDDGDRVSLMTLHAAKGLEFDTVFLPGWEEGLFPHQRSLDESGLAGLEEERRLAYVGITRARKSARISFANNRRNRGLYQSASPSRFVDELPEEHIDIIEAKSPFGGAYAQFGRANPYGPSRFDDQPMPFKSTYDTPGWQRAQQAWKSDASAGKKRSSGPITIDGEFTASSTVDSGYATGDRVTHQKFGPGTVTHVDGMKLTIEFDSGDTKRVVASYVERAG